MDVDALNPASQDSPDAAAASSDAPRMWLLSMLRDPRGGFYISLFWIPAAWLLARLSPWLAVALPGTEQAVNLLAPALTIGLILWLLWVTFSWINRTGRGAAALPLSAMQVVLFTLLFYQLARHGGAEHYSWRDVPGAFDWAVFSVSHALRASDIFDGFEAYGWELQPIRSRSHAASLLLVFYHFVVSLFVVTLFVAFVRRAKNDLWRDERRAARVLAAVGLCVAALVTVWLASALYLRPWRAIDILLWPIDNLIRVVDVFDIFEVYHLRLHRVPAAPFEATLTLACRVLMAVALAGLVGRFVAVMRLRHLGGYAMDLEDLDEMRTDALLARRDRKLAAERMARLERSAHRESFRHTMPRLAGTATLWTSWALVVCLAVFVLDPGSHPPAEKLADQAADLGNYKAPSAMQSLRRLGSAASPAVPTLAAAIDDYISGETALSRQRGLALVELLGYLGSDAAPPLAKLLLHDDGAVPETAVAALLQVGPAAVPALLAEMQHAAPAHRESCLSLIESMGTSAIQPLVDHVGPDHAADVVPLLVEFDPYWEWRSSDNESFHQIVAARELSRRLAKPRLSAPKMIEAVNELASLGRVAAAELPHVAPLVDHHDPRVATAAIDAVLHIAGPTVDSALAARLVEILVNQVRTGDPATRSAALARLTASELFAARSIAKLIALLPGRDATERDLLLDALERLRVELKQQDASWPRGQLSLETQRGLDALRHGADTQLQLFAARWQLESGDVPEDMHETLAAWLDRRDAATRRDALQLVTQLQGPGDAAIHTPTLQQSLLLPLLRCLQDADADVRSLALESLRPLGPLHVADDADRLDDVEVQAAAILADVFVKNQPRVNAYAEHQLERMLPSLIEAAADNEAADHREALAVLRDLRSAKSAGRPDLLGSLSTDLRASLDRAFTEERNRVALPIVEVRPLDPLTAASAKHVRSIAFSRDGRTLAAARPPHAGRGLDGAIVLWDVASRREESLIRQDASNRDEIVGPWAVRFSADGKRLLTVVGESAQMWDVSTRRPLVTQSLRTPSGADPPAAIHNPILSSTGAYTAWLEETPDGSRLAHVWNTATGHVDSLPAVHLSANFSPQEELAVRDEAGLALYDVAESRRQTVPLPTSQSLPPPEVFGFSARGDLYAYYWQPRAGAAGIVAIGLNDAPQEYQNDPRTRATRYAAGVARLTDGKLPLSSGQLYWAHLREVGINRVIDLQRLATGEVEHSIDAGAGAVADVYDLAFSPDGRLLSAATNDGIYLWNLERGRID